MRIYLVGGAVRDHFMGLPMKEKDYVVVGATPEEMVSQGYKPVGKDFPVFLHPKTKEEYALARTERKTGRGYTGFTFYSDPCVTLEDDLRRRDLTINAMALDENHHLIDPYGGKKDLEKKLLRHVSDAFVEDPVRVLRLARFMARFANLGFSIAEETKILLRKIVRSGEMNALVPERVWQEWQRSLVESAPEEFIKTLRLCGALAILFPEINHLFGIPDRPEFHPEIDVGIHTLMVLSYAARKTQNPIVCFAALLHDLGKAKTKMVFWPSHHGHEAAGKPLITALCLRYKVPREYADLAKLVAEYHLFVHRAHELKPSTLLKLFERVDAFRRPHRFELFLEACEADFFGRKNVAKQLYSQKNFLSSLFNEVKKVVPDQDKVKTWSGDKIKKHLYQLRISAIRNFPTARA